MDTTELRRASSLLFGSTYKLELVAALAAVGEGGLVMSEFADHREVAASVFYAPLRGLSELGLVRRLQRQAGTRHVPYVRSEAPAWTSLRALMHDLSVGDVAGPGVQGDSP